MICLEPWMPRWVHAAQVVVTIRSRDQGCHSAVGAVELSQCCEAGGYNCHGFRYHINYGLIVHFHGFIFTGSSS